MGLDLLDIELRLEERFGIRMDLSENVYFCVTPGRLQQFIWQKLQGEPFRVPQLMRLHNEVLDALRAVTRRRFSRSGDLNKLIKAEVRSEVWERLGQALGCRLPPLEVRCDDLEPAMPLGCDSTWLLAWWIAEHQPERVEWLQVDPASRAEQAERRWSEQDVWRGVQKCIAESLGLDPTDVTPSARLFEDLGAA